MRGRMEGCALSRASEPLQQGDGGALYRQGLGLIPLLIASPQEGPQWLHVRDFDRLLRESQREVLRLQRQIALRNQREPPPPPSRPPGLPAPVRAGAPTPGAPGEVSAWAGVWVCADEGWATPGSPLARRSESDPGVTWAILGFGKPSGRVSFRLSSSRTCATPSLLGFWGSALRRPAPRGASPAAPAAQPVVPPGSKSLVTLAAARGPAGASSSRCSGGAGTPPSAPARPARPRPGHPGVAVRPTGSRYGRPSLSKGLWQPLSEGQGPTTDSQNLRDLSLGGQHLGPPPSGKTVGGGTRLTKASRWGMLLAQILPFHQDTPPIKT
jgi:hypothetical protein